MTATFSISISGKGRMPTQRPRGILEPGTPRTPRIGIGRHHAQPGVVRVGRGPGPGRHRHRRPGASTWTASLWSSAPIRRPSTRLNLHRSGRTARVGAAGVVITVQTSAQAADVRALMGRAGVVPLATRVSPGSALLAAPRAASETALTARSATGRGAVVMSAGYRGRRRR